MEQAGQGPFPLPGVENLCSAGGGAVQGPLCSSTPCQTQGKKGDNRSFLFSVENSDRKIKKIIRCKREIQYEIVVID